MMQSLVWMISGLLAIWTFTLMNGLSRHSIPLFQFEGIIPKYELIFERLLSLLP